MKNNVVASVASAVFIGCIVGANWAIGNFGPVPVGFGLFAPAGIYFAGLTFGLRDVVQDKGGRRWVIGLIFVGAFISFLISGGEKIPSGVVSIALASGIAFLFSESADFFVYTPLRERNWVWAVVASNVVGSVVDSVIFLSLAFGSLNFLTGNVLGKFWMTLPAVALVGFFRGRK